MSEAIVTLKKGEGRTLKSGGMWVFDNEIATIVGSFEDGDIVTVHDFDGYPMGKGFINRNSKIRIRLMTRKKDQEIDAISLSNTHMPPLFKVRPSPFFNVTIASLISNLLFI